MSEFAPMSRPASPLTRAVTDNLRAQLAKDPDEAHLAQALRHLAKWRAQLILNTLAAKSGSKVLSGPFRGMDYAVAATEGAGAARLLGCYEASLHPIVEAAVARGYAQIIDIGCAEGYYAVGLALRLPQARVLAHDTNPAAQQACQGFAALNGVAG
ncbi:MAG: hypothetical protein ORN49_13820, partial [Rhodobacteraceae bacterium]|nr:hypothetical protein [Paracoccaceae bacterium]